MTSALDMPEIMSYIYSTSWKLQFSASSSIIIIEDYYLQTFLHSLTPKGVPLVKLIEPPCTERYVRLSNDLKIQSDVRYFYLRYFYLRFF